MNRRQMFKAIIGTAIAAAIPSMPFIWRELTFSEIVANTMRARKREVAESVLRNNAFLQRLKSQESFSISATLSVPGR